MKIKQTKRFSVRSATGLLALLMCTLCVFWLAGCAAPAEDSSAGGSGASGAEGPVASEQFTGTITSISDSELLVEITESSMDALQGSVRVGIGEIDSSIIASLKVGDTVKVGCSGIMGMSEPPYIPAMTLEVVQ